MWELDCEEGWVLKNWCFWTVVLEKTVESPLEIQPVHSEGDQPWDFFGRNDAKAETPVLWASHAKSWLIGKDSDAGRDWGQEGKRTTEDEMAGWHHRLDGCESEWTPEDGDGQGGLACCDSWGPKESDTTEWLNWTDWTDAVLSEIPFVYSGYWRAIAGETLLISTKLQKLNSQKQGPNVILGAHTICSSPLTSLSFYFVSSPCLSYYLAKTNFLGFVLFFIITRSLMQNLLCHLN